MVTTQPAPLIRKQTTIVSEMAKSSNNGGESEEEESGLLFVNPDDERKARLEKEKQLKKKEIPMLKLKDGSQAMMLPGLVTASSSSYNNANA